LYGFLIEVIQNSLEYRTFELYDLLSDIIGVIVGYMSWKYLKKFYPDYWFIRISP
jgi:VanZ family protein